MNVPKDLQQFIGDQLLQGNYESLDDLLTEALILLREKREADFFEAIDIGRRQIENGECVELDTKEQIDKYFEGIKHRRPKNPSEPAT